MHHVRRRTSPHAARLRRDQTDVEQRIWLVVRDRRLDGFKFRRQATIDRYVVDFLCVEARLVVELDGGQHSEERDAERTAVIEALGYRVIRFWNGDVIGNLEGVLANIHAVLMERVAGKKALTQPSPAKAGEG